MVTSVVVVSYVIYVGLPKIIPVLVNIGYPSLAFIIGGANSFRSNTYVTSFTSSSFPAWSIPFA